MQPGLLSRHTQSKKKLLTIIVLAIIEIALILFFAYQIQSKNNQLANANNKLADLNQKLDSAENQISDERRKLKDVAFFVHPESQYAKFRKNAYLEVLRQAFPSSVFDEHDVALVRVFHTTAFRNVDNFFSEIENDDILLYDEKLAAKSGSVEAVIVRPREQKIIAQGLVATESIKKARSDNITKSQFGPTLNYFSEQ